MPQSSQLIAAFGGGSTAANASLGATALGAGLSAGADYGAGEYQAQVARNNQSIANSNADLAEFKGTQQTNIAQQRTAQTIGMQRAGAGASGVDVNSGSPLRAQEDTARIGAMDAETIKANADRSAWGFKTQAENFGNEAKLDSSRGDFGVATSLIGGGANFADKWQKYTTQTGP